MRRLPVLVAVALALGACAAPAVAPDDVDRPSAAPALPPVAGISAEAVLLRTDEAEGGRFQVRITATGTEPFGVRSVGLAVPGFAPLPPTPVTAEFVPGRVIDLPTPYGPPDCAVAPEPAAVRLAVVRPGGAVEEVTVPLAGDVPARLHADACAAEAVAEVVVVAVTGVQPGEGQLAGQLTVRRRAWEVPVTVERLGRSVLVDVVAQDLPVRLDPGADVVAVPVTFRPATCEPHVLAETKQPYVFPLDVALGEEAPVVVDLPVDDALRAALGDLVRRVCAGDRTP